MSIIIAKPPNFSEILALFPDANRKNVIFAYEPHIYAPGGDVPPELVIHEGVHITRQKDIGVERWWKLYLSSAAFRYEEELLAHRAEYQYMISEAGSRSLRRGALKVVAKRLSSPLYGGLKSMEAAMKDLQA